jgi:hypothetical protein
MLGNTIQLRLICQSAIEGALTALIEVHWARKVQAAMPRISGPNIKEKQIIDVSKKRGIPFPDRKPLRGKDEKKNLRHVCWPLGQIANSIRKSSTYSRKATSVIIF